MPRKRRRVLMRLDLVIQHATHLHLGVNHHLDLAVRKYLRAVRSCVLGANLVGRNVQLAAVGLQCVGLQHIHGFIRAVVVNLALRKPAHAPVRLYADRTLHRLKATAIGIHVVVREVKHLGESGLVSCVRSAGQQTQNQHRPKPDELLQLQHHRVREIFKAIEAHRNFRFGYARLKLEAVCLGNTARSQELIGAIQFDHCLCKGL